MVEYAMRPLNVARADRGECPEAAQLGPAHGRRLFTWFFSRKSGTEPKTRDVSRDGGSPDEGYFRRPQIPGFDLVPEPA